MAPGEAASSRSRVVVVVVVVVTVYSLLRCPFQSLEEEEERVVG